MSFDPNTSPIVSGNLFIKNALKPYLENFNIAHLNCQSIRPSSRLTKFDELKLIFNESPLDIFAVTETWLKPYISSKAIDVSGFNFCRNDRLCSRGGGVGLYISKNLKFRKVFQTNVLGACESLFIELYLNGVLFLFGVVYLPHGNIESFENLHQELFLKYTNIIIVGDFNNNMFDPSKSYNMRLFCSRCNLSIVHNSKPTHIDVAHSSSSLIDFWLVSDYSLVGFSDQVYTPSISHHSLIFSSFLIKMSRKSEFIEFRDFNSVDWDTLSLRLSNFEFSHFCRYNVDDQCYLLNSLLTELFDCVPVIRRKVCHNDSSWMSCNEIRFAQSLRDLAYLSFLRDRSAENWRIFCRHRNKAKNVIRKVKRRHFSKIFYGLNSSGVWRLLKSGGCVNDDAVAYEGNLDELNDYFVSGGNIVNTADPFLSNFSDSYDSFSFRCISDTELFIALNKVKSKSVGTDNIPISFIKLIFPQISCYILHLFNSILTTSTFPSYWKIARVTPIPKTKFVHEPEDLRPISILPALSKVLEHILKDQILESVSGELYKGQFAFRRGYSTTSLLLSLTDRIRHNFNNEQFNVLVALDLSKAFNSIDHNRLIYILKDDFHFSKTACCLINSYLKYRFQFVELNGFKSCINPLYSGVPQGSVLGPLLFILYVNNLYQCIDSALCEPFLYADDIFLLFTSRLDNDDVLTSNINFSLQCIQDWALNRSLNINPSKTKAIMFGPTTRFFTELNIYLGGVKIDFVDCIKCLGVMLDCSLSFNDHFNVLSSKIFNILRKLYATNFHLPLRIRYILGHSLLMSHILYGLEVFSGSFSSNFNRVKLVFNSIIRFVYKLGRREHISPFANRFLGCSFNEFVICRNLLFFYKIFKAGRPISLYESFRFLHSTRNPQIFIPRIAGPFFEKSFLVRIARCWNRLPYCLRIFSHSNNVFRLKLVQFLLTTSF